MSETGRITIFKRCLSVWIQIPTRITKKKQKTKQKVVESSPSAKMLERTVVYY